MCRKEVCFVIGFAVVLGLLVLLLSLEFKVGYAVFQPHFGPGPGIDKVLVFLQSLSASKAGSLKLMASPYADNAGSEEVLNLNLDGNVADYAGGRTFKIVGAVNCEAGGAIGEACRFSGQDSYVAHAIQDGIVEGMNKFSISVWVKNELSEAPNNKIIAYVSGNVFMLNWDTDERFHFGVYGQDGSSAWVASDLPYTDTNWHHLVGVYDGSSVKLYVDGVLQSEVKAFSQPVRQVNNAFTISGPREFAWQGEIDEVRVFSRGLDEQEVQAMFSEVAQQAQQSQQVGSCAPEWVCGVWSECENGLSTRTCTDANACGTNEGKPEEAKACERVVTTAILGNETNGTIGNETNGTLASQCKAEWSCGEWSECKDGEQTRECVQLTTCPNAVKPETRRACEEKEQKEEQAVEKKSATAQTPKKFVPRAPKQQFMFKPAQPIIPRPKPQCRFLDVSWTDKDGNKLTEASDGQVVYLSVLAEGCNGKKVNFKIFETDNVFGVEQLDARQAVFTNGIARKPFVVRWEEDRVLGLPIGGNPDLVFTAKTNPQGSSNTLEVLPSPSGAGGGGQLFAGSNSFVDDFTTLDYVNQASFNNVEWDGVTNIHPVVAQGQETQPDADTILLLHMNGNSLDSSNNGHPVSETGGITCNAIGMFNQACTFDGLDDYLTVEVPG
ncbi:LamG domain-containing protein, partial [Candidatus Pacearchaeota archaeon]